AQLKLLFVGRLTPDKGWGFTCKALEVFFQTTPADQIALLIAGDGSMRDEIAQALQPLTPHVHFLGRVAPQQVPALYANSDIHVTTSEKEARGLTVLEAFASAIPVLAPRAGGLMENINDGWNGFLYEPQSIPDFVDKLQQLHQSPQQRQQMGQRGKEQMEDYSWEKAVQNLVSLWQAEIASLSLGPE
ncbi:MAG: glycosyltransferase, partial [Acaryochloridaceae cyanobacterium CSU_5_19]|nr:glycosyltransferase [Acaryochloridaceae cyanobacterium CSU_5_19]